MKTAVTEMFGLEFPILAFSHCRDVVAAVTKAGGLGVLGAVGHTPKQLEIDLAWIEEEVGEMPYGVDMIVPAKYEGSGDGGFTSDQIKQLLPPKHIEFVDDLLARYGVTDGEGGSGGWGGDAPFSANRAEPQLEIALAHRTALIANALGPPPQFMIDAAHKEGRLIAALAGRGVHAERHVNAGVDLIIAQGYEAGGHTGEIGSMVLIPEVVDAVAPVPVLGAGGIGRGRQMAAAMALGATGVWCGSVWLTTQEAETTPAVKEKFLAATSADTMRSRSITGKPARMLKSSWTDEWENNDEIEPLGMPMQMVLTAEARQRIDTAAHQSGSGAEKLANYFVGQVVGTMNRSIPAARVVHEMVDEFVDAVQGLGQHLIAE